jgi:integrase
MTQPSSRHADLTNAIAETAAPPSAGQYFIRDARLPGFALRVTAGGVKSWIVEARVKGQRSTKRRTLGRYPQVKADRARTLALQELGRFAEGVDQLIEERKAKAKTVTLGQVFEDYLASRDLKPQSVDDYRRAFKTSLEDWRGRQITEITRSMVEQRHAREGKRSHARANNAFRLLRALINFAIGKYEDGEGQPIITDNPVTRLSATRAWFRIERRRTLIRLHQMPAWFEAVERLYEQPNLAPVVADWLQFLILTGCRRKESMNLKWSDVDLKARFFQLPDTKNRQVHELPLSDYLTEVLTRRYQNRVPDNEHVFPGRKDGPLAKEKHWLQWVAEESDVAFTPHDLRRTFATVAESCDISGYTLKRLMNHVSGAGGDVTGGYLIIDVERLRVPMQRITDAILTAAGRRGPKADVIQIQARLDHAGRSAS